MTPITGTRADYYSKLAYHHTNRPQYESMKSLQKAESAKFGDVPYHFVIDGSVVADIQKCDFLENWRKKIV